jgi:hypothetical protein
MPGNALLRRLGVERPTIIESASDAADSGFWLALRIGPDVRDDQLASFLERWASADLSSITDLAVTDYVARSEVSRDGRFQWLTEARVASGVSDVAPMIVAADRSAERRCAAMSGVLVALDEVIPEGFADPCFGARAEREKSFVRCAKVLVAAAAENRIDRLSFWTRTPRVLGACRGAARAAGLDFGRYEFCVPDSERPTAEDLLREGETVRMCFFLDRSAIERAVAR